MQKILRFPRSLTAPCLPRKLCATSSFANNEATDMPTEDNPTEDSKLLFSVSLVNKPKSYWMTKICLYFTFVFLITFKDYTNVTLILCIDVATYLVVMYIV